MYVANLIIYSSVPAGSATNTPNPTTSAGQSVWDLNGDHVCNIGDIVDIGMYWQETGSPGWIKEDVNHDGAINIGDVVIVGLHWNGTW